MEIFAIVMIVLAAVLVLISAGQARSNGRLQRELVGTKRQLDQLESRAAAGIDRLESNVDALMGRGPASVRSDLRHFVAHHKFPTGMVERALAKESLSDSAKDRVVEGFRQFLYAAGKSPQMKVAMPSQLVDLLWHEFMIYTREYQQFCMDAYGKMLHHIPEVVMDEDELSTNHSTSLANAWTNACSYAEADDVVPALFAVDAENRVPHADTYVIKGRANRAHQVLVSSFLPEPAPPVVTKKAPRSSTRGRSSDSSSSSGSVDFAGLAMLGAFSTSSDPSPVTSSGGDSGGGSSGGGSSCGGGGSSCGGGGGGCGS